MLQPRIVRLLAAAVISFLVLAPPPRSSAAPAVTVGFNGYIKEDNWFPVSIAGAPGWQLRSVVVMRSDVCSDKFHPVGQFGFAGDPRTGGWSALAHLPDGYGKALLRCEFVLEDGAARSIDTPLDCLGSSDLLILIVTPRPEEFGFLGSVESGGRRVARCVARGADVVGDAWQTMQAVDVVVLDGPPPAGQGSVSALRDWITRGGTVIATDRALQGADGWGLLTPPTASNAYREAEGCAASWLLDARAEALASFRYRDATQPGFTGLVPAGAGALVSARQVGLGRVIASGVDWDSLVLRDRALYETVRRALWTRLLDFRSPAPSREMDREIAIPREAQVRFLMWPLLGFLVLCCALLGPVNWLVLARMRRLEYTVVTLPAGAAILAALALVIGQSLRSRDVVVTDRVVTVTDAGGAAWSRGLSGVLSPGFRRYAVAIDDGRASLTEQKARRFGSDEPDPSVRVTRTDAGMRLDGVGIETWAMRFFSSQRPGGDDGLLAWGEVTATNRLSGTVINRSARPVEDAWIRCRWDRVPLGTLGPHSTNVFDLVLGASGANALRLCPNCHRFHVTADAFDTRPGQTNVSAALKAMADACNEPLGETPVIIGLDDGLPPLLRVEGAGAARVRRDERRMVVAHVALRWHAASVVPDGFAYPLPLPKPSNRPGLSEEDEWGKSLGSIDVAYIPHAFAVRDALARLAPQPRGAAASAPDSEDRDPELRCFALPASVTSGVVSVLWDMGPPDPDEPAGEAAVEILDWRSGAWVELGRSSTGDHRVVVPDRVGCILATHPAVALRVRPTAPATTSPTRAEQPGAEPKFRRVSARYLNVAVEPGRSHP